MAILGHFTNAARQRWTQPWRLTGSCLSILIAAMFFANAITLGYGQSGGVTESQIKAAFLYNFTKFVQWPADAFLSPDSPLRICTLGENLFGPDLEEIVRGKTVSGHPVQVQSLQSLQQVRGCQVLFIGNRELPRLKEVLNAVRGASVLTVSESPGFAAQGAMIGFVMENDQLRFEINAKAAREAQLNISAKLLSLARKVIE